MRPLRPEGGGIASGSHQQFYSGDFLREFEAELIGFIIRKPIGHLRKHDFVKLECPFIPRGSIKRPFGLRKRGKQLFPNRFRIGQFGGGFWRIAKIKTQLLGLVVHVETCFCSLCGRH